MSDLWLVLGMGIGVHTLRIAGMFVPDLSIPPAWERALGFVPAALLTALVVSSLNGRADGDAERVIAGAGAGFVAYRTRRMWACIASGMALYWLLRIP